MRSISPHRPKEKLRGIKRRLKAIDKWADTFKDYFPTEYSEEKYCNWKIPVLDRMVNRPTTTKELQAHCANALFKAASYIEDAKPEALKTAKVSVLLTHPDMFSSEICVFFDEQYFEWFFDRHGEEHKLKKLSSGSLAKELNLIIPQGFSEVGYQSTMKNEYDGEVSIHEENWWLYSKI